MAKPPVDKSAVADDAFMREVDEAVRRSDAESFARRYGWWIVGLILFGLTGFGGWIAYQNHRDVEAGRVAEAYVTALDKAAGSGKGAEAAKAFAELDTGGNALYGGAARIMRANMLVEDGRLDEAATIFSEVAADSSLPQPVRDLALVKRVAAGFDKMKPQQVIDALKPLMGEDSSWFPSAAELTALAYLRMDKPKEAGKLFARIAETEDMPNSLTSRARQMAGVLGIDTVKDDDTVQGSDTKNEDKAAGTATSGQGSDEGKSE